MKFGPYFHSAKPDCAARAVRGTILTFDCSTTHVGSLARSGQFDVRLDRTASVELKRQAVAPPPQSTTPVSHPWMTTIQLRVVWIREPANHRSPSSPRRIPRRIVTTGVRPWMQRAIRRILSFQFWSAYVPCGAAQLNAVQLSLEQIDVIRRLAEMNAQHLTLVTSVKGE